MYFKQFLNALYDEILLKMFAKYNTNQDFGESSIQNEFIVFHLMGTHGGYASRYPKDMERFTPQDLRAKGLDRFYGEIKKPLDDTQLQMRTDYANAVAYNDKIVAQIIKEFENDEAIIFYFSDHCDEVFDERDFVGHTYSFVSRYMVEIPFMIYMSDKFMNKSYIDSLKARYTLIFETQNRGYFPNYNAMSLGAWLLKKYGINHALNNMGNIFKMPKQFYVFRVE